MQLFIVPFFPALSRAIPILYTPSIPLPSAFPQHWTASGPIEKHSKPRLPSVALFSPIYLYICYFYSLAWVTPILSYNCSHLPPRSQKINHFLSLPFSISSSLSASFYSSCLPPSLYHLFPQSLIFHSSQIELLRCSQL